GATADAVFATFAIPTTAPYPPSVRYRPSAERVRQPSEVELGEPLKVPPAAAPVRLNVLTDAPPVVNSRSSHGAAAVERAVLPSPTCDTTRWPEPKSARTAPAAHASAAMKAAAGSWDRIVRPPMDPRARSASARRRTGVLSLAGGLTIGGPASLCGPGTGPTD